jgi:hypothetical protein
MRRSRSKQKGEESTVRNSDTGSTRSGWRILGQVAVATGPNWAAASRGRKKKAWPAGRMAGNHPTIELGGRKTFSLIKTPLYF